MNLLKNIIGISMFVILICCVGVTYSQNKSCGQAEDSWLISDGVTLKQWHKRDCDFINRRETRNVPIGDPESETYRLSTFKNFSQTIPINPCRFASSGFYYTGYGDRVKCFSCGQAADSWLIGDDVTLKQWHKRDCDFINGRETGNVPIGSIFGRRPRVDTVASSSQPGNISVPQPQVNGIGNMTAAASNASRRNSLPNAAIAFPAQLPAAPNTNQFETPSTHGHSASHLTEQERRNLKAMFPCDNPINPHMRWADSRLQTFLDNPGTWPARRVRATPQEIVDAKMYYLGERDRVKCWYCNGGLQNWDRDDNPWEEHAKWFPMCEYVLQQKGPTLVHDIVARFPNLRRPVLYNPSTASATNQLREVQTGPRRRIQNLRPICFRSFTKMNTLKNIIGISMFVILVCPVTFTYSQSQRRKIQNLRPVCFRSFTKMNSSKNIIGISVFVILICCVGVTYSQNQSEDSKTDLEDFHEIAQFIENAAPMYELAIVIQKLKQVIEAHAFLTGMKEKYLNFCERLVRDSEKANNGDEDLEDQLKTKLDQNEDQEKKLDKRFYKFELAILVAIVIAAYWYYTRNITRNLRTHPLNQVHPVSDVMDEVMYDDD